MRGVFIPLLTIWGVVLKSQAMEFFCVILVCNNIRQSQLGKIESTNIDITKRHYQNHLKSIIM